MTDSECYAEWHGFYREFFPDEDSARRFVQECDDKHPPRHPSRLIMHQCKRLISIARDVRSIHPGYHSFQIFLMLVCAEAVTKLHDLKGPGNSGSRDTVRRFFQVLLPEAEQQRLVGGLRSLADEILPVRDVADALYDVRCDVAHEGQYWSIFLSKDGVSTVSRGWPLSASLWLDDLDEIVVAGCIAAAQSRLSDNDIEVPQG